MAITRIHNVSFEHRYAWNISTFVGHIAEVKSRFGVLLSRPRNNLAENRGLRRVSVLAWPWTSGPGGQGSWNLPFCELLCSQYLYSRQNMNNGRVQKGLAVRKREPVKIEAQPMTSPDTAKTRRSF